MKGDDRFDGRRRGKSAIASAASVCLTVVALVVVLVVVGAGVGPALATDGGGATTGSIHVTESAPYGASDGLQRADVRMDAGGEEDDEAEREAEEEQEGNQDDDEAVPTLLGDWWGLDIDADEGPFVGLAQLGALVLVVGAGGYVASKRYSFVPVQYRRRTLQVHEWMMLTGTALVAPHFVFAEELEGLGLFLGILLGVEVLSGFYGRHLHRRVIRLSRGDETPALVGRALETTNERLFSRWRRIHVTLVSITALALLVHVLSEAW